MAFVAVAFLLVPAGASAADVTIGSNLAGAATTNICSQGIACTYVQTTGGTRSRCHRSPARSSAGG
jgi:hypothetical protein